MPRYQSNNFSNLLSNYQSNDRSYNLTYYEYDYLSNYLFKKAKAISTKLQELNSKLLCTSRKSLQKVLRKCGESPEKLLRKS